MTILKFYSTFSDIKKTYWKLLSQTLSTVWCSQIQEQLILILDIEIIELPLHEMPSQLPNKLRVIGFCGVDDSTSPDLLQIISHQYPWVEWGVLFRSDLAGTPRYASWDWVISLGAVKSAYNKMKLAAHLCSDRCLQVLQGDVSFVTRLVRDIGFARIQINPTAANNVIMDPENFNNYADGILGCVKSLPEAEWLFQLNNETRPIWELLLLKGLPTNISILHDASCGKGVKIDSFPLPQLFGSVPCGYAGGIGPQTIESVLRTIEEEVSLRPEIDRPVWIDMESSLRTITITDISTHETYDVFDINKTMQCITTAVKCGMPNCQLLL